MNLGQCHTRNELVIKRTQRALEVGRVAPRGRRSIVGAGRRRYGGRGGRR